MRPSARHGQEGQGDIDLAASLLERALAEVPTTWGKLVRISRFRVPGSDEYAHADLARIVSHDVAVKAVRRVHERLFYDWLRLNLEEQYKDLAEYVEEAGKVGDPKPSDHWESLVPPTASAAERALFETDLSVVLEMTEQ
jgi:hypothetical protein